MNHITEHIDLLRNTDPDLLALIGEQPLPPPQQPMAPTPTGQSIPIQPGQGNVPKGALQGSPMEGVMGAQQAEQIATSSGEMQNLPNIPKPPAPFETMPVNPQEMIPS